MGIPLRVALYDPQGNARPNEELILLSDQKRTFHFDGFSAAPILSINRGFSAPVIIDTNRSQNDLAFLSAHDDDPFARYEAMQQLMVNVLAAAVTGQSADEAPVIAAGRRTLMDSALDDSLLADAVTLPSEKIGRA